MKALVIGSRGQVGSCLVNQLSQMEDVKLFAVDRTELDISDWEQVLEVVKRISPNVIINAAAYTSVDLAESEEELCYLANATGPKYLAMIAEMLDVPLLHISTDYVFGGEKTSPYIETDVTNPKSVYGRSKLEGENAIINHCSKYVILRTAWVFGAIGSNFVKTMIRLSHNHNEIAVVGDQLGGPTYADDIASALIVIMREFQSKGSSISGVYHYSGSPYVSWYDFAKIIFDEAKESGLISNIPTVKQIDTSSYPTPAFRPVNSRLCCSKILDVFGIETSDWNLALKKNVSLF